MNCQNDFCIYQRDGVCCLEEISIDKMGVCENCIYPEFDKIYLNSEKDRLLNTFELRDSELGD